MSYKPKIYYEPSDYDDYDRHLKVLGGIFAITFAILIGCLVCMPATDGKWSYTGSLIILGLYCLSAITYAVFALYHDTYTKICKALAYVQMTSMGYPNGIEVRTASDIVLLFRVPYRVAERIVHGDYDNLLRHPKTCSYIR